MTPQEQAAAMVADPAWGFAEDPVRAISHATVTAASALEGRGAQYRWASYSERMAQVRYWTAVGVALCESAGVEPGQVLTGMRRRLAVG